MNGTPREWLAAARAEATASWDEGGIPIGAVLVNADGEIVARGHNCRQQHGDPTAHAEMICIRNAGRRRDWSRLVLVTTLSPCAMCAGTILLHRIPRVIIGENRSFRGEEELLRSRGVTIEVLDDEHCAALMAQLVREKPDLWAEDIGEPSGE